MAILCQKSINAWHKNILDHIVDNFLIHGTTVRIQCKNSLKIQRSKKIPEEVSFSLGHLLHLISFTS